MKIVRTYQKGEDISYTLPQTGRPWTVQIADNVHKISFIADGSGNDLSGRLEEVPHFNQSLTCLDDNCFYMCGKIDKLYISPQMRSLNSQFMEGCSNIKAVTYDIYEHGKTDEDETPALNYIGKRAFAECGSMRSLTLPESITAVEQLDTRAFEDSGLTSVTFLGMTSDKFMGA